MQYDLVIIGSGPAGQKAAIAAAKQGWRVLVIERRRELLGGVSLHTGTIPSKTIREAVLHLTGFRHRDVYDESFRKKCDITMDDLRQMMAKVGQSEWQVLLDQFARNRIDLDWGEASFVSPHRVSVCHEGELHEYEGRHILVATGTRPARPDHIPFDGHTVFDSEELLNLERIPRSMIVVGGGVIGLEYALTFAVLGVEVTVVDGRERLLEFCDREIVDALLYHARSLGMVFRLGESVVSIDHVRPELVSVELKSGKRLVGETVLFSVGRVGDTSHLRLERAGLEADARGRLECNEFFRTPVPHIYAVGDVVGFPALASTAMEQGRRAVCHMVGRVFEPCRLMPYGLFTIPEISMVGENEEQLTAAQIPYEVGVARYGEIARGHIAGDQTGMLKVLFHRESHRLLGVHAIGESATEIIHIGQAVMALGGTLEYFRDTVFNYPTMTECYKVAALDGLNKLSALEEAMKLEAERDFMPAVEVQAGPYAIAVSTPV